VKRGPLIAAVVSAGVIILMIGVLILPKASQVRSKQREVDQAEQQESILTLQLQQLQAAAKDAPQDRKKLAGLQAAIPSTADLPGLIRLLNTAAAQTDVDFLAVSPGSPTSSADGKTSVIPTQITVVGEFFAVDQYLFQLETLPRAAKVNSVQLSPQGWPKIQVALSVDFYTTDTSAGPGSIPGATTGQTVGLPGMPGPSPSGLVPSASPSPSVSP